MKKLLKYGLLSLTAIAGMSFTSCSSEEDFGTSHGQKVMLTINASKDAQTRTAFQEENGSLSCTWTADDALLVTSAKGERLGVISLVNGAGNSTATFRGEVTLDNQQEVNLFYFGHNKPIPATLSGTSYELDLSAQDGSFASLAENDFMTQEVSVTRLNGEATGNVTMMRRVAEGKFNLHLPDGLQLEAGDVVTISQPDGHFRVTPKFKYATCGSVVNTNENGTLTITKKEAGNDLYVTIFPQTLTPTFTVTKGEKVYTCTLGEHRWTESSFVRAGDGSGVPVNLVDNDAPDHTKNPLAKWAESDLKRVSTGASTKSDFTGVYTTTGSYYQFGRNYGFHSVSDAQQAYGVERSDMASNRNVYSGTGSTSTVSTYYASTINFANYPNYFFIDNNHNGDYTAPDHAQTWYERAKSNGYTYDSPCPDGWRLPTVAEYKEIMPVIDGKAGNSGSSAWNDLVQFKTLDNGVKCAFRWSKYTSGGYSYLKIDCIVVPKDMTDTSAVDWTDENVETRYFKGAGYIQAHRNLWNLSTSAGSSTQYTARPLEWGTYSGTIGGSGYAGVVIVSQTASYMRYGGFYWTSDAVQGVFSMIFNSSSGYNLGYYLSQYDSAIGANIRCVRE